MNENLKLKKTHQHLTLVFTGVVFAIVSIIGLSLIFTKYINEIQSEKRDFKEEVRRVSDSIKNEEDFLENFFQFSEILKGKKLPEFKGGKSPNRVSFYLIDAEGNIAFENLLEQPNFKDLNFPHDTLSKKSGDFVYQTQIGDDLVVLYSEIHTDISDLFKDIGLLFALCIIFSGLFYFIGYKFVGRALVPVEKNMQDMQDFIHNAWHELKTPLAVMRGNLQLMQVLEKYDVDLLKSSIKNVDTMSNLIEGLRELSELGKNSEKSDLSLSEVGEKIMDRYASLASEKNILLERKIPKTSKIFANENELEILISNLVSNAIRYNTENGKVSVLYQKNVLTVQDTGSWIPESMQEKIYDRFFQGENARSHEGFGIGLSLVKKICDINGWKIDMKSSEKGTSFRVFF